ncbi:beta-lactamase-like protein [Leptodontidium sp. 2 PMI_412]|nr:beta-lactamase-like protein [Leptodontidium sp. 2 PMI_412]
MGLANGGRPMSRNFNRLLLSSKKTQKENCMLLSLTMTNPPRGNQEGLINETGSGGNWPTVWGPPYNDLVAQIDYTEDKELPAAIAKTGHSTKDVKAAILGHLHLDHAGGPEHFVGTDIPIHVHEKELKHAFYSVATGSDAVVYMTHYLCFDFKWKTFNTEFLEIFPGLTMRHALSHTPGLCLMQVNLRESGTWIFTSDQYHVKENYEQDHPQGWQVRDHDDWIHSNQKIHMLARRTDAKLVFGHDKETFFSYKHAPEFYM